MIQHGHVVQLSPELRLLVEKQVHHLETKDLHACMHNKVSMHLFLFVAALGGATSLPFTPTPPSHTSPPQLFKVCMGGGLGMHAPLYPPPPHLLVPPHPLLPLLTLSHTSPPPPTPFPLTPPKASTPTADTTMCKGEVTGSDTAPATDAFKVSMGRA